MDILYISSACSEETLKKVSNKYMRGIPLKAPQQTFDLSVALGLSQLDNVELISLPPLPSYPKSKCIIFPKKIERLHGKFDIKYIPVINLPILKAICIFLFTLFYIFKWNKANSNEKVIILHWPYFPTMIAAYIAKFITHNQVILTIPDLPYYSATYNKNLSINDKLMILINKITPNLINKFDGYILLTEYMRKKLDIIDKPYMIMEGLIREENILIDNNLQQKYKERVIMYAGAVYERFGIKNLVEAFHNYVTEECELWIYGSGDFVTELKRYEKIDKRIKYKGIRFRDEVLEAERKSTLLVNPRPTKEEFTKYSFPSKTLEYMASGTPILSTKLAGIPKEYRDYVLWIEDESIEGLGNRINSLISNPKWLHEFGIKAQQWVKKNKNNEYQAKRILDFISSEFFSKQK